MSNALRSITNTLFDTDPSSLMIPKPDTVVIIANTTSAKKIFQFSRNTAMFSRFTTSRSNNTHSTPSENDDDGVVK